jgi:hypothetical protein
MNELEKVTFSTESVMAYLEDMIQSGLASDEEIEFYENCLWSGKMKKLNNTYKQIIFSMRDEWEMKF